MTAQSPDLAPAGAVTCRCTVPAAPALSAIGCVPQLPKWPTFGLVIDTVVPERPVLELGTYAASSHQGGCGPVAQPSSGTSIEAPAWMVLQSGAVAFDTS